MNIKKEFAAEECELDRVRQCWAQQPPVMREVLVLTPTLATTLQSLQPGCDGWAGPLGALRL